MTRALPAQTGFCGYAADTQVVMSDGQIVAIDNLSVGDLVMGPDSKPRRVLDVFEEEANLCKVIPVKGDPWICAETTTLTVSDRLGNKRDVSVEYLLNCWSKASSRSCRLFRQGIVLPTAVQPFDPYLLGVWIGDGDRGGSRITTADPEIAAYLHKEAERLGMHCQSTVKEKDQHRPFPPRTISLAVDGHGKGQPRDCRNALRTFIRSQCVRGEDKSKYIPLMYLLADKEQRLALLAGIIDTDGSYDGRSKLGCGTYEISTVFPILRDQILYLARSLGFSANSSEGFKTNQTVGFAGLYSRIIISGALHEVPCLLPRKNVNKTCKQRSHRTELTAFSLESVGFGSFVGVKLDSDERFLLGDFTAAYAGSMVRRRVVRSAARLRWRKDVEAGSNEILTAEARRE